MQEKAMLEYVKWRAFSDEVRRLLGVDAQPLQNKIANQNNSPAPAANYNLMEHGEVTYQGITARPAPRLREHIEAGKRFDAAVFGPMLPRALARAIEVVRLEQHRQIHGENPPDNKSRNG